MFRSVLPDEGMLLTRVLLAFASTVQPEGPEAFPATIHTPPQARQKGFLLSRLLSLTGPDPLRSLPLRPLAGLSVRLHG